MPEEIRIEEVEDINWDEYYESLRPLIKEMGIFQRKILKSNSEMFKLEKGPKSTSQNEEYSEK